MPPTRSKRPVGADTQPPAPKRVCTLPTLPSATATPPTGSKRPADADTPPPAAKRVCTDEADLVRGGTRTGEVPCRLGLCSPPVMWCLCYSVIVCCVCVCVCCVVCYLLGVY